MGCKDKKKKLINKVFHSVGPVMPGSDRAISSSKKPVFKDDRAKIPFSSSKLVQNEDEKAKTTLSSSKMPQNKDEPTVVVWRF